MAPICFRLARLAAPLIVALSLGSQAVGEDTATRLGDWDFAKFHGS